MSEAVRQEVLERVAAMRDTLDRIEKRVRKGQLYSAFTEFKEAKRQSYAGALFLSDKSFNAARDWGHLVSIRDANGKHKGWAIFSDD